MERNRTLPPGLAGLLALGMLGASEQDARRSSNPDNRRRDDGNDGSRGPFTGDPELDALLASGPGSEGGMGALLAALLGGGKPRRKSAIEVAADEVAEALAPYNGDSKRAARDAEEASRAAGKPVGLLAASIKLAEAEIAEYNEGSSFDNDYGIKDVLELAHKVTSTVALRESAQAIVTGKRENDGPINVTGMELAARVVWASAVKVIRGFAIVCEREGVSFDPKLPAVTPDNAAWTFVDEAVNDGE